MIKVIIELEIDGNADDAQHVIERLLDDGAIQEPINNHELDAGPLVVTSAEAWIAHDDHATNIRIQVGEDAPIDMPLDHWIDQNEDGMSPEDIAAIRALKVGATFRGGGKGTLPWSIKVTSAPGSTRA